MRKDKNIIEEFPSIYHLMNCLNDRKNNEEMANEHSSESGTKSFTGTDSLEEAIDLLYNGAEDIAKRISIATANVDFSQYLPKRQILTGPVGYIPHVPNAILGLPNSMIYNNATPMKNKALMITTSICGNCGIEASDMEKAGICILSVVKALELSGHRIKLRTSFFDAKSGQYYTMATINVKDYSEHLDLKKLSFPMAHPSMFRRIGFKWLETSPDIPKGSGFNCGYGHHASVSELKSAGILEENEVYLDYDTIRDCNFNPKTVIERVFKK